MINFSIGQTNNKSFRSGFYFIKKSSTTNQSLILIPLNQMINFSTGQTKNMSYCSGLYFIKISSTTGHTLILISLN